ncbi:UNVERIFIED_CONTAM: TPR repeat-containing thioredoxin TDX [Sesamum calycinum]|uniref:TPR repeat-containing thioredoxin TDX n=1 Tax=Sesamum calycinum TaxID=2727403 RepID=A0AAW2IR81_9LAMI
MRSKSIGTFCVVSDKSTHVLRWKGHLGEIIHLEVVQRPLKGKWDRSTGKVIEIESSSETGIKLRAASNLSRLTVVYFTATWSGPCCYIAPRYANLAAKYPKVVFLKVDIDKAKDVAMEWNVYSIPSFYLINSDRETDIIIDVDMDLLENKITKHFGISEDSLTSALNPCEMEDYEQLLPV